MRSACLPDTIQDWTVSVDAEEVCSGSRHLARKTMRSTCLPDTIQDWTVCVDAEEVWACPVQTMRPSIKCFQSHWRLQTIVNNAR